MKLSKTLPIAATLLGLAGLLSTPQAAATAFGAPGAQDEATSGTGGTTSLDRMRQQLEDTQETVAQLAKELSEVRTRLDLAVGYIERQGTAAQAMTAVLAEAEAAGFAMGINHGSRKLLLAGWRKQLANMASGLPKSPVPVKGAAPARTRR